MKTSICMQERCVASVLISALLLIYGCDESSTGPDENENTLTLLQTIQAQSNLSILESLFEETGFNEPFTGDEKLTIFAPSDDAFDKLPGDYLDNLTDQQKLDLLKYHLINRSYPIENRLKRETIVTLQGDWLYVESGQNSGDRINNTAKIVTKNISAKNGYVHIIDEVLKFDEIGTLYDNIKKLEGYSTFFDRLEAVGLSDFLQAPGEKTLIPSYDTYLDTYESNYGRPFTEEEWKQIIGYHVLDHDITKLPVGSRNTLATLSGDSVYLYIAPDCFVFNVNSFGECGWGGPEYTLKSTNGYILAGSGGWLPDKYIDVASIIHKRFYLSAFSEAMTSEIYDMLINEDEKFTIFVTSNHGEGLNSLPASESDLTELLKYHILLDAFTKEQLQHNQTYATWHGGQIHIAKNGDQLVINGSAIVTQTNLIGKNGVVHFIDRVLTPAD